LAARIAERTGGVWRPGPGAVYPALQRLSDRGLAKAQGAGRRREYHITLEGRRLLRKIRKERAGGSGSGPDLSLLWAEIVGAPDDSTFLLQRLRRSLDGIEAQLVREPGGQGGVRTLRVNVLSELRAAERRMARPGQGESRTRGRAGANP